MITNSSIRFNQGVFLEGITLIRNVSQGSCMSDTNNWKLQWKRGTPEQSSSISDTSNWKLQWKRGTPEQSPYISDTSNWKL